jgi:hypothetical protein
VFSGVVAWPEAVYTLREKLAECQKTAWQRIAMLAA